MRKILWILLLGNFNLLNGQTIDTIYYKKEANNIKAIESKQNGEYHGEYKMWYPNGQLKMKGLITIGKWSGKWEYYNPNGEIHKTGEYVNSLSHGIWNMYNLIGKVIARKTYENGKLLKIDFLDNVYFEYDFQVTDSETIQLNKSFEAINADEFILFEPIMLSNINFLEQNPFAEELSVLSQFVTIWTSNCPYLGGQLNLDISNYTVDWTRLEKTYKYSSLMTVYFVIGKCAYLIENKGKKYELAKSEYRATESMIKAYKIIIANEANAQNEKMNELTKKYDKKQLELFIQNYYKKK